MEFTSGPANESNGAYQFKGATDSFIQFPNTGGILDVKYSITLMCWVRPGGQDGPLFNYKRQGAWGVHIWIAGNGRFFVRITKFGSHAFLTALSTDQPLEQGRWYHVAATYDSNTGVNSIYVDGVLNKTQNIGTGYRISTNDPAIRMGVKIGDRRLFNGAITQMGIYNVSLTGDQIRTVIKQGGNIDDVFIPMYIIITLILIFVIITANQHNYDHNKLLIFDTFISVKHLYFLTSVCLHKPENVCGQYAEKRRI